MVTRGSRTDHSSDIEIILKQKVRSKLIALYYLRLQRNLIN